MSIQFETGAEWLQNYHRLYPVRLSKTPDFQPVAATELAELSGQPSYPMTTEMLMRLLSNRATAALEAPHEHRWVFNVFTAGASSVDRATALELDRIRNADPGALASVAASGDESHPDPGGFTTAVAAVRANLAAECERNLDELQLEIHSTWRNRGRLVSLVTGFGIAFIVGLISGAIDTKLVLIALVAPAIAAIVFVTFALFEWIRDIFANHAAIGLSLSGVLFLSATMGSVMLVVGASHMEPLRGREQILPLLAIGGLAGIGAALLYELGKTVVMRRR
jgi:hypothetical protein